MKVHDLQANLKINNSPQGIGWWLCRAHAVLLAPGLESKRVPDTLVFVFPAVSNAHFGKKGLL